MPTIDDYHATYNDLNVMIPFTGKLRLARCFIEELYVQMGFQKPSAFETVLDITLRDGKITDNKDRSQEVAKIRGVSSSLLNLL